MSLQRASWLTVVIICAIGALVLALNGYVGYPIVVGAVRPEGGRPSPLHEVDSVERHQAAGERFFQTAQSLVDEGANCARLR